MRTVIAIENSPGIASALSTSPELGYRVIHYAEGQAALDAVRKGDALAIVLDLELEQGDPFALLEELGRICGAPPVLALTSGNDPRLVARAVRSGASDVLPKAAGVPEIRDFLTRCLVGAEEEPMFFVGRSAAMKKIRREVEVFARSEYPILITGESGTGKELVARAIHALSSRKAHEHVALNCAAIPTELVESELFGSSKGAFTGASDRPGAFELADGGTLFLDEIGDAPPQTQAKLLRALESGSVRRLGARRSVEVDVRFVSATGKNLDEAMARGEFRSDLFYRVETLRIAMPPLRDRRDDIPALARFFMRDAARGCKDIGESAIDKLSAHDWPGNVRQLRNAILRAVVVAGSRETIRAEDILL